MIDRDKYQDLPACYSIQVQGSISDSWTDWLGEMEIVSEESDGSTTTLSGPVADQAALRGVLARIWDLNLTLISVTRVESAQYEEANREMEEAV